MTSNNMRFAHSLYSADDVVPGKVSKCGYIKWASPPHWRKRKACSLQLHKGASRTPKLIYSYKTVKSNFYTATEILPSRYNHTKSCLNLFDTLILTNKIPKIIQIALFIKSVLQIYVNFETLILSLRVI